MEYYVVAARWWVDTIKFSDGSNFNMSHDSRDQFAMLLGLYNARATNSGISQKTYEDFEKCLIEVIQEEVNRYGSCTLQCDYGPMGELAIAAQRANMPTGGFPWKTSMEIKPNKITVRKGYGAQEDEIFKV